MINLATKGSDLKKAKDLDNTLVSATREDAINAMGQPLNSEPTYHSDAVIDISAGLTINPEKLQINLNSSCALDYNKSNVRMLKMVLHDNPEVCGRLIKTLWKELRI